MRGDPPATAARFCVFGSLRRDRCRSLSARPPPRKTFTRAVCRPDATLTNRPIATSMIIKLAPPYEMNGSGTPVSGAIPSTAKKLSSAWQATMLVMPIASMRA